VITEKASEWFFALPKADAAEQAAFGAWLKESPRHVEEFLMVSAAYKELEHAPVDLHANVETLRGHTASILPLPGKSSPLARQKRPRRNLALVAALACLAIAAGWASYLRLFNGDKYTTAIGEIRSFELQDGSLVQLNTLSKVRVDFSTEAREVQLLSGEAIFKVARDAARPFRVHAGNAVIQALGTEFNVYRRAQETTISVLEGSVRVSEGTGTRAQTLQAGQEAHIASSGKVAQLMAADTVKATAWRQRRLVFRGDPLADVAAEFNRYNRAPQIRVEGQMARSKPLAGIFDANDPESLLQFLAGVDGLQTRRDAGEVIISSR
jgi:transmembrane sensor